MATGLTLLVIGMLTVFLVLTSVVLTGKTLIFVSNRLILNSAGNDHSESAEIPDHVKTLAQKIVDTETQGMGNVMKIEPLKAPQNE